MLAVYFVLVMLAAYLIGAIPIGVVVAWVNRVDVTAHGSGRMGSTNVLRTVGRRAAALVLVGDFLKGVCAVGFAKLIAGLFLTAGGRVHWLGLSMQLITLATVLAALAAVSGHVWSIYLRVLQGKWKGGRGVATALGAMLMVNPWVLLVALAVGVPTIVISRYVSLGSILGAAAGGLAVVGLVLFGQMDALALLFVLLSAFIIVSHRDNIERLLKGTERKLGERAAVNTRHPLSG